MTHVLAQARLATDSGSPEDIVVNTFHFDTTDTSEGNMENLAAVIGGWYVQLDDWLSGVIAQQGHEVRVYNMTHPEPREPIATSFFTLTPSVQEPLPNEVAVCLSYRGAQVSGANMARRRGRIYFGPLDRGVSSISGSYTRPSDTFLQELVDAAVDLAQAAGTLYSSTWSVYSRASNQLVPIAAFWADDEWDTQRRRGARATKRVTPS